MAGRVTTTLRRRATAWAGMLTRIAKEFAPNHIKSHISSRVEERGKDAYTIFLTARKVAGPPHAGSMDAAAQEYGSGEHSENSPGKYVILPKNYPYLVFKWDKVDLPLARHTRDGRVKLEKVNHPGIAPYRGSGYLRPAIQELRAKGTKELREDIRQAILGDIAESFRNANKR